MRFYLQVPILPTVETLAVYYYLKIIQYIGKVYNEQLTLRTEFSACSFVN